MPASKDAGTGAGGAAAPRCPGAMTLALYAPMKEHAFGREDLGRYGTRNCPFPHSVLPDDEVADADLSERAAVQIARAAALAGNDPFARSAKPVARAVAPGRPA